MHEFHGTAATDHVDRGWRSGGIEDGGRRHREAGAHPLAARLDQMAGNLGEEIAFRLDDAKKLVLGAGEVVDHRGKDGEGMCHALHATPCADRSAKAAPAGHLNRFENIGCDNRWFGSSQREEVPYVGSCT